MSKKINLGPVTAYAIAVANGYEGTKEEWLASLKGEKGDQGEKGEKGDTGAQGPKGPKGDGVTSWNQLEDKPFYAETAVREVLAECQPEMRSSDTETAFVITETAEPFVVGETYTVKWNGVDYDCVAQDASAAMVGMVVIGNGSSLPSSLQLSGNDEPFIIARNDSALAAYALDGSTTLTISIRQETETIHKLDNKFLPFIVFSASETGGIACNYDYEMTKKLIYNCSPIYAMAGTINTLEARPYTFMREMAITVTVTEGNDVETPFITIEFPTVGTLRYYSTGVIE